MLMFGCSNEDNRPLSNTPEHKAQHGYKKNQTTIIWVGNNLLSFPSDLEFNPVSSDVITKGRADSVTVGLRYPELNSSEILNLVVITLRGHGYENPQELEIEFKKKKWKSIKDKLDLDLREYVAINEFSGWGGVTYKHLSDEIKTPKGSAITYRCNGYPHGNIDSCLHSFVILNDLNVQYKIPAPLLPHWKVIHRDVVDLVNKLSTNNTEI
jgi:hypothetical protein